MRVSPIALLAVAASCFPSMLPRSGSFSLEAIRNPDHVHHGPSAKSKAMAKYAHLAGYPASHLAAPCKFGPSLDSVHLSVLIGFSN